MGFRRAIGRDELWAGELAGVTVAGVAVVLVAVDDQVCAYEDRCAHQCAKLSEGLLQERVLTCGVHGWSYDASTGRGINPENVCLRRFPVIVEDGAILVDVESEP